jgi:site-specific DNA-cytosine methylase
MADGIMSFGFPCQPFSCAGKRKGTEDERWLFDVCCDGIEILKPRFAFAENVEGLLSAKMPDGTLVIGHIITRLEALGYTVEGGIFSAEECGAPHRRKRVFILAKLPDARLLSRCTEQEQQQEERPEEFNGGGELANTGSKGLEGLRQCSGSQGRKEPPRHIGGCGQVWPARPGQQQYDWEPPRTVVGNTEHDGHAATENRGSSCEKQEEGRVQELERGREQAPNDRQIESSLGRNFNEFTDRLVHAELFESCDNRTDELRLLGNGVCIPTVTRAWEVLYRRLTEGDSNEQH